MNSGQERYFIVWWPGGGSEPYHTTCCYSSLPLQLIWICFYALGFLINFKILKIPVLEFLGKRLKSSGLGSLIVFEVASSFNIP